MHTQSLKNRTDVNKSNFVSNGTASSGVNFNYIIVPHRLTEVRCQGKCKRAGKGTLLGKFEKGAKGELQCPDSRCKHKNCFEVK